MRVKRGIEFEIFLFITALFAVHERKNSSSICHLGLRRRFFLYIDDVSENYRPRSLGWVGTLKNKRDEGGTLSRQ